MAGSGYTEIKSLVNGYSFTDSSLVHGVNYCYRIQPEFADTTAGGYYYNQSPGLPSNEACITYQGITTATGINEPKNDLGAKLFPNPASEEVNLQFALSQSSEIAVRIFDVNGQIVFSESQIFASGTNNLTINVKGFAAGIYTVQLLTTQQSSVLKLVKQ